MKFDKEEIELMLGHLIGNGLNNETTTIGEVKLHFEEKKAFFEYVEAIPAEEQVIDLKRADFSKNIFGTNDVKISFSTKLNEEASHLVMNFKVEAKNIDINTLELHIQAEKDRQLTYSKKLRM